MPYFLRFSEKVSGWLDYLNKNREVAKDLFKGMAVVLTVFLIPALIKGAIAMAGMFAPLLTGTGLVIALGAALILLYRDYKRWKEGKDSYFDWGKLDEKITYILKKLDEFKAWFKNTTIGKWFTDAKGEVDLLKAAFAGLALYIGTKWVGKILKAFGKIIKGAGKLGRGLGSKAIIGALLYEPVDEIMTSIVGEEKKKIS